MAHKDHKGMKITSGTGQAPRTTAYMKKLDSGGHAEEWKKLEEAIVGIQSRRSTSVRFEDLYRITFKMVTNKCGKEMHAKYRELVDSDIRNKILPTVLSSLDGQDLLETIVKTWLEHDLGARMASSVLMYLDRNSGLTPVYKVGVEAFKNEILNHAEVGNALRGMMPAIVSSERATDVAEPNFLREAIQMLLAISEVDGDRRFYESSFETEFLDDNREFYRRKGQQLYDAGSMETFFRGVQRCYEQENGRASLYDLDSTTREKMNQVLNAELLEPHMIAALRMPGDGMFSHLENRSIDALRIAYEVSDRLLAGRTEIKTMLGDWTWSKGAEIFKANTGAQDTTETIERLIQLDDLIKGYVAEAFGGDDEFKRTVEESFYRLMGDHRESPHLLSAYVDVKMRTVLNDAGMDAELILTQCLTMFKYLAEKDAFERRYIRDIGKRLLSGKYNAEVERSLIQKFKGECGSAYTDTMEQMFKDIDISATHDEMFREKNPEAGSKITVQVLKAVNWRIPESRCKLPPVMEGLFKRFEHFYGTAHNGRRLRLCTSRGTVELKASFGQNQPTKTLIVPTGLASVLAEFNQHSTRTYQQLVNDTQLPEDELKRYLQSVSMGTQKQRIMARKGQGVEIAPDDEFSINESFTSKSTRVKIQLVSSSARIKAEEQKTFKKQLDEGRKIEVDAAIVRTMKARQTIEHNSLVVEVINQLAKRFQPDQTLIKRCIEDLIERDFIQRSLEDQRRYRYVA